MIFAAAEHARLLLLNRRVRKERRADAIGLHGA